MKIVEGGLILFCFVCGEEYFRFMREKLVVRYFNLSFRGIFEKGIFFI